ncbi:MAG: hypothetical protein B7Y99_09780 [Caulobacterales bacterium 32-69-10]|nr:MAG: hypothetical protein B7Y99_09780 [Caulobacterales bacterium 32-69-10]
MKALAAGLICAAALALAGCYESKALLLDPKQAVAPLAVGTQTLADEGERPYDVEISLGPDRWYTINTRDGRGRADRFLFTPLPGGLDGEFAFAVGGRGAWLYGVAERRDGRIYLDVPFCDLGPARDAALAHGVKIDPKRAMAPSCTFTRGADLTGALADYARRAGKPKLPNLPAG